MIAPHILAGLGWSALALVAGWGLLILADVFLFPRWWPSRWFAPVCAVLRHTDEDMDEDEPGFGVCARCGTVFWPKGGK
jgi:hypothetical protein